MFSSSKMLVDWAMAYEGILKPGDLVRVRNSFSLTSPTGVPYYHSDENLGSKFGVPSDGTLECGSLLTLLQPVKGTKTTMSTEPFSVASEDYLAKYWTTIVCVTSEQLYWKVASHIGVVYISNEYIVPLVDTTSQEAV